MKISGVLFWSKALRNFGADYIVWGCYWGGIIVVSTVFDASIKRLNERLRIDTEAGYWKTCQMVRTFFLFCGGRLITAAGDLASTGEILRSMFSRFNPWILRDGSVYALGLDRNNFWVGIFAVLFLWHISIQQERGIRIREKVASYPIILRWAVYYALVVVIIIFGMYGPGYDSSDFVYMQF